MSLTPRSIQQRGGILAGWITSVRYSASSCIQVYRIVLFLLSALTIVSSVRAVINLEAAGTTGRELLFQATSEQMIQAYSHVPRPFGTVIANEIFSSGIMMSE